MNLFRRWSSSIWRVLINPTPKTFLAISDDVDGIFGESVFLFSVFTTISFIVVVSKGYFERSFFLDLIGAILLFLLFILLFNYFINYINDRIFHNQSVFQERLYFSIFVIILISIILDNLLLIFLPNLVFLGYASTLYTVFLFIICIKSITNLSYWQTIITLFLSSVLSAISLIIVGFFFSRLIYLIPYWFDYF